jgi:hypothetical protein
MVLLISHPLAKDITLKQDISTVGTNHAGAVGTFHTAESGTLVATVVVARHSYGFTTSIHRTNIQASIVLQVRLTWRMHVAMEQTVGRLRQDSVCNGVHTPTMRT